MDVGPGAVGLQREVVREREREEKRTTTHPKKSKSSKQSKANETHMCTWCGGGLQSREGQGRGETYKVADGGAVALEPPLGGEQARDADRAAGVQPGSADADLGAEAEAEAVREARAGVVEDTGTVGALQTPSKKNPGVWLVND